MLKSKDSEIHDMRDHHEDNTQRCVEECFQGSNCKVVSVQFIEQGQTRLLKQLRGCIPARSSVSSLCTP